MFRTSLALAAVLFASSVSQAATQIHCQAIHEYLDVNNNLQRQTADAKIVAEYPGMVMLEAELDNRHFSLRGDPNGQEFLIFITEGPDYTRGVVANAGFNDSNQLRVSVVNGSVVHKISCWR